MSKSFLLPTGICVFAISLFLVEHLFADPPEATEFKGVLKSLQRGILVVTREDGSEVTVRPPDDVWDLEFVASAKPAFLQAEMMVRFESTYEKKTAHVSGEKITHIQVFQPIAGRIPSHLWKKFISGVFPVRPKKNQPAMPTASCKVNGMLMGLDASGTMLLQVGRRPFELQIRDDTRFEICFNNLSLAEEGDTVSVTGSYQPPDENKVKADRLTITTDRVFDELTKATPRRTSRRSSRRTKKTEVEQNAPVEFGAESTPKAKPQQDP